MKDISEILNELGIDIPAEKATELNTAVAKSYTATEEYNSPYMDVLRDAVDGYKFSSAAEKKAMMKELSEMGLPYSDGKILGLGDAVNQIMRRNGRSPAPAEEQKPGVTKADIMKIKDTAARQKAIAENIELFQK